MKQRMIITDLDGTLLNNKKQIGDRDLKTLEQARSMNIVRVMATGRHLFSIKRTFGENPPFDFAILSCGNGIYSFAQKKLIRSLCFTQNEAREIISWLKIKSIDFMAHTPLPDNHYFTYHFFDSIKPAFKRRLDLYQGYAFPYDQNKTKGHEISQFVIICEPEGFEKIRDLVHSAFSKYTIVYSSSPLLDESIWLEILPAEASKSQGSEALCRILGITPDRVMALGNDFNDKDLLEWAPYSYVVDNAPWELKQTHRLVGSHNQNPLSEAFSHWIAINATR